MLNQEQNYIVQQDIGNDAVRVRTIMGCGLIFLHITYYQIYISHLRTDIWTVRKDEDVNIYILVGSVAFLR
jgi:hypothetical protein